MSEEIYQRTIRKEALKQISILVDDMGNIFGNEEVEEKLSKLLKKLQKSYTEDIENFEDRKKILKKT